MGFYGVIFRFSCVALPAFVLVTTLAQGNGILKPNSRDQSADWLLAAKAREKLWADPELASLSIDVTVHNRVARLYGAVPAESFRKQAAEVVRQTEGIKNVINYIRVRPTPAAPGRRLPRLGPVDEPPAPPPLNSIRSKEVTPPAKKEATDKIDPIPGQLLNRERPTPGKADEWRPLSKKVEAPSKPELRPRVKLLAPIPVTQP